MHNLPHIDGPRFARSVGLQALGLACAALLGGRPWAHREAVPPAPPPEPPRHERRIRVVQIPRPPPPAQAHSAPPPPLKAPPPKPAARPAPAPTRIAADSTAVHGVRLRVMVPRSPADLASHLRRSGGCLVVSRVSGGSAEVLSVLGSDGREVPGPPCDGVPRVLRDSALNAALGDPIGRARAESPGELVLQVLLSPGLPDIAQSALRARFGALPEQEMARRAAESGYELTCFADPAGPLRCQ